MISVINTEPEVTSDLYSGMNLAEACNAMELSVMEIVNEFYMGILLTEHAYLYENGVEMEYVDEAGNLNENAVDLKAKAINMVTSAGKWILGVFDKAIEKVNEATAGLRNNIAKAGIRTSDINNIINNSSVVFADDMVVAKVSRYVDPSFTQTGRFAGLFRNYKQTDEAREDPYEMYVTVGEKKINVDSGLFKAAWEAINSNHIKNSIKEAKRAANEGIKDQITRIKKMDREGMESEIAELKHTIVGNKNIAKSLVRVYNDYTNQQIAIIRATMNSPVGRDVIRHGRKDAVKAAPGKAKNAAAGAARSAAGAVTSAPGKAKNAVVSAPSKAREAIENAKDEIEFRKISNNVKKFNKNVEKQEKKQAKEEAKAPKEKKHFVNPLKKK